MSRIRTDKKTRFAVVSNDTAQNDDLSWEALGLLTYCLSMPEDWEFHPKLLWKKRKCGRNKMYSIWSELIEAGHCIRIYSKMSEGSNLSGSVSYEVFDDVDRCKCRCEELLSTSTRIDCREDFKKCFRRSDFRDPGFRDSENRDTTKKDLPTNKETPQKRSLVNDRPTAPTLTEDPKNRVPEKRRAKLTPEQEESLALLEDAGMDSDADTLRFMAKTYPKFMIEKAIEYTNEQQKLGTTIKSRGAFVRSILDGKIIPVNGKVAKNKLLAQQFMDGHDWHGISFKKRYAVCSITGKEIAYTLDPTEFMRQVHDAYDHEMRKRKENR